MSLLRCAILTWNSELFNDKSSVYSSGDRSECHCYKGVVSDNCLHSFQRCHAHVSGPLCQRVWQEEPVYGIITLVQPDYY
jgi:hypothetical protein